MFRLKGGPVQTGSGPNKGWLDENGNSWVPDKLHKDHWDVQRSDGKGYINVYPNGRRRDGEGKPPRLPKVPAVTPAPPTSTPQPQQTPNANPTPAPGPAPGPAPVVVPQAERDYSPSYSSGVGADDLSWLPPLITCVTIFAGLVLIPITNGASAVLVF